MPSTRIEWIESQAVPQCARRIDIGDPTTGPDAQLLVTLGDSSDLLVTLRSTVPECFPFQDATTWHQLLVVGWGCAYYIIQLEDDTYKRHPVATYFGSIATGTEFGRGDDFLLILCGERITRINEDGTIAWVSEPVGLDGVTVSDAKSGIVDGDGEWDPPGGWKPYRLRLADGHVLSGGKPDW